MAKNPKAKTQPEPSRVPRAQTDPEIYWQRTPSWRVAKMEFVEPFGWHKLEEPKLREIQGKLACFESMTWAEILIRARKQNHRVPIHRICREAQTRLAEMGQADVDHVVSLHLSGAERIWGILNEGVLTVLWWDPVHQVCPALLKHT